MLKAVNDVQAKVLDGIAHGDAPEEILAVLCRAFEAAAPGRIAGVTVLDRSTTTFEPGIFPSLATAFGNALAGIKVADKPGSCALAVAEGTPVEVPDVAQDDRFADEWRSLMLEHGLRALVSVPAAQRDGVVLGTFVVAHNAAAMNAQDWSLAEEYANLCGQVLAYRRVRAGQDLIVGELQHRVRNLFGTVGVLVYQTLKANPDPASFRRVLDGRLTALSRAHALALESVDNDLRQILVDTLAPYSIDHSVEIEGPPIRLTQEAAMAFCLATHELATNAAKYGALSQPGGGLRIGWKFASSADDQRFLFEWSEHDGPPVRRPERQGFGQRTIQRTLASAFDGHTQLDYAPAGFRMTLTAPKSVRLGKLVN